jgi:hypothetical protein
VNYYKNKVAWCPICNQGWVEIYKDKIIGELLVLCNECESMWKHPDEVQKFKKFRSVFDTETTEIMNDESEELSLVDWEVDIAQPTDKEIRVKGWEKYIIKN